VDRNWTVKVADFGLSVVKKDAAAKKEKHGPIGTPLWMAPEVLMNKEYNEKADVVRHLFCVISFFVFFVIYLLLLFLFYYLFIYL
jgi:serine/threonine protein kinase